MKHHGTLVLVGSLVYLFVASESTPFNNNNNNNSEDDLDLVSSPSSPSSSSTLSPSSSSKMSNHMMVTSSLPLTNSNNFSNNSKSDLSQSNNIINNSNSHNSTTIFSSLADAPSLSSSSSSSSLPPPLPSSSFLQSNKSFPLNININNVTISPPTSYMLPRDLNTTSSSPSEGLMTAQIFPNAQVLKGTLNDTAILRCLIINRNTNFPPKNVIWEKIVTRSIGTNSDNKDDKPSLTVQSEPWEPIIYDDRIFLGTNNNNVGGGGGGGNGSTTISSTFGDDLDRFSLTIKSLRLSDNGTYACRDAGGIGDQLNNNGNLSRLDLFVIEPARLDSLTIEPINPRSVNISWLLRSNGNTQVHRIYLEMRNITETAAFNDAGQSDWVIGNVTMPPDVPSPVTQLHVLSRTNETIWIGWRKPPEDNGADIIEYILELRDADDRLLYNKSFQINRETGGSGSRLMFMFVGLVPATNYTVRVRACSSLGCGKWSDPKFQVSTLDGIAEAPENVILRCFYDSDRSSNRVNITWDPPSKSRGTIVGYNVSLEGHSSYRNADNQMEMDNFKKIYPVDSNESSLSLDVKPNTNYTVRLCTLNKAGCGELSVITSSTMCYSSPTVPPSIPGAGSLLSLVDPDDPFCRQLKLTIPRLSERNGPIKCYKIVIIKLPKNTETNLVLPPLPSNVNITTYADVHSSTFAALQSNDTTLLGAYIADEMSPDNLADEIIIGDGEHSSCEDGRIPRRIDPGYMMTTPSEIINNNNNNNVNSNTNNPNQNGPNSIHINIHTNGVNHHHHHNHSHSNLNYGPYYSTIGLSSLNNLIADGPLDSSTNYSGFIEVRVLGPNGVYLTKQSDFFDTITTGSVDPRVGSLSPLSPIFASLSDSAAAILFGIVCGLALILFSVLSVICFLRTKVDDSLSETGDDERLGLTALLRRTVVGTKNGHIISNGVIGSINGHKWIGQPIPIQNLPNVFIERHANSDLLFQSEFEALPENFGDRTSIDSNLTENVGKNRYPDIKCYDQTRVKLSPIEGIPGSDYINANFVEGYKGRKLYICAQGPVEKTVTDFWRMIYEQKVSVIVMLTGIEEHGKIKCSHYWTDSGTKKIDTLYTVSLTSYTKYSDFIIRRFSLTRLDADEDELPRDVLQFHFLLWKDFLAPEQPSWLLRFIKRVNEHYCPDKGPLLVHCSAGVGRTGTFIAIDSLVPEITCGTTINIYECVSQLRYQRNFLVQSFKQYIFVYRALMEFAQFGDTEIEICHLKDHYRQLKEQKFEGNINGVMAEFDRLNEVIEDPKSCCVGLMDMNMNKNRYDFIIPHDINRVILPPLPTKENSSYINASFVQGYDRCLSFIVTQDPLDTTVLDFWRMILEQNVSILVMLSELGDGQSKCYCYWPKTETVFDYVKIIPESEQELDNYMIRKFYVVNTKNNDSVQLTQYHFMLWRSGVVPEATLPILKLIEVTLSSNSSSSSPIVIHCSGGGDRSSLFVTLSSLTQQIRTDGRVDIFQTARYTRSQRPCMLQTIAQYDFIYRSLIDFIDSHNLCDNMSDTQL
ncbi:tyrosine-protein phosphatase 69D-like isoform X2 [Panonychus citri]|uniref:tyrosine-protein phosphatase 69D-like isoform X2 n=1 Tax=Panonychus citri TaxID=50023 RepID=UPI0023079FB3|nr:tyrosine-protein phosphatase 69D-like isoform X2 [Panonychus citri]XP_053206527.1 tyrosine-protein phosphatase 69D-like isoform X2 [Panonychus citri]